MTLWFVIITAVCQIICLNKALQCADTVVVVPLFYAGESLLLESCTTLTSQDIPSWGELQYLAKQNQLTSRFINSLIFYDEAGQYEHWVSCLLSSTRDKLMNKVLVMVFISISVLISGVVLLSLKSSAKSATDPYTISTRATPSMRLNPRSNSRVVSKSDSEPADESEQAGSPNRPKDEVMWEVGSVSDDEDESRVEGAGAEETKHGLGEGSGRGQGERRGLLDDEDEGDVEGEGEGDEQSEKGKRARKDEDEGDEGFGEYEAVAPRRSDEGPFVK